MIVVKINELIHKPSNYHHKYKRIQNIELQNVCGIHPQNTNNELINRFKIKLIDTFTP